MAATDLKGVIFDLDGVITRTARVHAMAWESAFNEFLKDWAKKNNAGFEPFDRKDDYLTYVDGKPRFEGVLSFLKSRNIQLAPGTPEDAPGLDTICALGNLKNDQFQELLRREGPEVFPGSVDLINNLRKNGIRVGVATSSRNCDLVLSLAGLETLFEVKVDGLVSAELGLKGKPEADIFTTAAEQMGLKPGQCVVVEDAISGVQAGNSGNFGMVIGVARNTAGELLRRFGADIVVTDLAEVTVDGIKQWFALSGPEDEWLLTYHGYDPGDEKLRETLTTVGNGYMGTRGAFEAEEAGYNNYPGTYIAGIFNKVPTPMQGRDIWNNDFVNCPNWTQIEFRVDNGEFMSPLHMELLSYRHRLNMKEAVMQRDMVVKDKIGRITRISSQRIISMADPHMAAQQYEIAPANYSGTITVRSSIDGNVINGGVARYSSLTSRHLCRVGGGKADEGIWLHTETSHSRYQVLMAGKTNVLEDGKPMELKKRVLQEQAKVVEEVTFPIEETSNYVIEKLVCIRTSLDPDAEKDLRVQATKQLENYKSFQGVYGPHTRAWAALWDKADMKLAGDRFIQRVLRLHTYHLLVTASPNNVGLDVGMPARGLSGEAYRGHIFWDEVYIQPFFDAHFPEVSKALLTYRYHRLPAARAYAKENGYEGAMYPWQTADDGSEETQEVHYNPESKKWDPDLSRRQRHVSIAVFVNAWRYVHMTGDQQFLKDHGAEIMLDIAKFWGSIATKDKKSSKFHIDGVMGPDEFHEAVPGSKEHGLRDNAYTNIMVVWLLEKALHLSEELPKDKFSRLKKKLGIKKADIEKWQAMTLGLNVNLTKDGIIEQFDGYMGLPELDWEGYRKRFYSIHRMDRILKAENDSPDNYKVAKQADTLMTWYILEPDEVARILKQLGYNPGDPTELLLKNYDFYEKRTSHGSTLSKVVHSVLASYIYPSNVSWDWFMEAMKSDIFDTQGGTTIEGIHTGVMAGTLEVIRQDFAGLDLSGEYVRINPDLPEHWTKLEFRFCHRKVWYDVAIDRKEVKLSGKSRNGKPITAEICSEIWEMPSGDEVVVAVPEE